MNTNNYQKVKDLYSTLNREQKREVIKLSAKHFKLTEATIKSNWFSRWKINYGIYDKYCERDLIKIINKVTK